MENRTSGNNEVEGGVTGRRIGQRLSLAPLVDCIARFESEAVHQVSAHIMCFGQSGYSSAGEQTVWGGEVGGSIPSTRTKILSQAY